MSSRRRHTRWPRDWSSDVCSSDLRCRLGVWCRLGFWLDGHVGLVLTTSTVVDRDLDGVLAGLCEIDRCGESAVIIGGGWSAHGSFVGRGVDHIDQQWGTSVETAPLETEGFTGLDGPAGGIERVGLADLHPLRLLLLVGRRRRGHRGGGAEGARRGQQEARAHPRRGLSVPEGHRTLL